MNYIIGKLNSIDEINQAISYVESVGFIKASRSGRRVTDSALRLFEREGTKYYAFGNYEGYVRYKKNGINPYVTCDVLSLDTYKVIHPTKEKDTQPFNDVKTSPATEAATIKYRAVINEDYIQFKKTDIISAYNRVNHDLKQLLIYMCGGKDIFVEATYKVGDKFERGSKHYVLSKINTNVITLLDCETFENFGLSIAVTDINAITETEFKRLAGAWHNLFKLIVK